MMLDTGHSYGIISLDFSNSGKPIAKKFLFTGMLNECSSTFNLCQRADLIIDFTSKEVIKCRAYWISFDEVDDFIEMKYPELRNNVDISYDIRTLHE